MSYTIKYNQQDMHCHASKKKRKKRKTELCGQPAHFFLLFSYRKRSPSSQQETHGSALTVLSLHTHTHTHTHTHIWIHSPGRLWKQGVVPKKSFVVTVKEEQCWACLNHYVPLWPSLTLIDDVHLKRITSVKESIWIPSVDTLKFIQAKNKNVVDATYNITKKQCLFLF